jgi:hypothetical protein
MSTDLYHNSNEFESINDKLRQHIQLANDEIEKVKGYVNELVVIVHNDNPTWSMKKICNYIAGKNSDLEEFGFSASTIYRYLNEENRKLIDARKSHSGSSGSSSGRKPKYAPSPELEDFREQKGKWTILQENDTEQFGFIERNQKVPEQSSSTTSTTSPSIEIANSLEELLGKETTTDDDEDDEQEEADRIATAAASSDLQQRIWALEQRIVYLEEDRRNLQKSYDVEETIIVKGQEIPIIIHVDPYTRTAKPEFDQKKG